MKRTILAALAALAIVAATGTATAATHYPYGTWYGFPAVHITTSGGRAITAYQEHGKTLVPASYLGTVTGGKLTLSGYTGKLTLPAPKVVAPSEPTDAQVKAAYNIQYSAAEAQVQVVEGALVSWIDKGNSPSQTDVALLAQTADEIGNEAASVLSVPIDNNSKTQVDARQDLTLYLTTAVDQTTAADWAAQQSVAGNHSVYVQDAETALTDNEILNGWQKDVGQEEAALAANQ